MQLRLELEVRFQPGPYSNGIHLLTEDVTVVGIYCGPACDVSPDLMKVRIPARCFQQSKDGFRVRDPVGCGVQVVLEFPPTSNDPNGQIVDLSGELQSIDIRLIEFPGPFTLRIEAMFASNDPTPEFSPLQNAARYVMLQIGDDSGSVGITKIEFEGEG